MKISILSYLIVLSSVFFFFFNFGNSTSTNSILDKESKTLILDDSNFEQQIAKGVTLVDFWAPWCGPCRTQGPIVDQIANEIGDKAKIAKLDVDKARSTSSKYFIRSIPTIIIFKDGVVKERLVGLRSKEEIVSLLNKHIQ
jgi:thioredoxin 1